MLMSSRLFSDDELQESTKLLALVVDAFTDEHGSEPTLGEFLEILGPSIPTNNAYMGASPIPLKFKAKTKGNRSYKSEPSERVADLNDNTFNEASELLAFLAERAGSADGQEVSPTDLAGYVFQVLQAARFPFFDVSSDSVVDLTAPVPKRIPKAKVGDVVAIPAAEAGYHLALVLADDQTGLALGLLRGTFSVPRVGNVDRHQPLHIPVYTGQALIKNGTWLIVDHQETLLGLFPDPPELYWEAVTAFGDRFGEYGAAGIIDGPKRLINKAEAEAVGLLNGTYRQSFLEEHLQTILNAGQFDNGPVPGFWR
jgi:hypothetical protein